MPTDTVDFDSTDDIALADKMNAGRRQILAELHKLIVGQEDVIELVLLTLFVGGNSLIVGVPGLAKTLLIATLAQVLELKFNRIQFTPDLMPSDITGTDIINEDAATGRRQMVFAPGPIFANIVLADEINRTPPKTQSALLEAMQEHRVTIQGRTYTLDGAVLRVRDAEPDRARRHVSAARSAARSLHVPHRHRASAGRRGVRGRADDDGDAGSAFERPVTGDDLIAFQRLVRRVPVAEPVMRYALNLVRTSRPKAKQAPDSVKKWVAFGASVRAAQYLVLGAKARALTSGRYHVSFDDIRALAHPVLRHRVLTNFRAESEGVTTDSIIDELLARCPCRNRDVADTRHGRAR